MQPITFGSMLSNLLPAVPQTMTSTERRPVNGTGNTTSANLFSFHGTPAASSPAPSQLFGSGGMALGNTSSALASGVPAFGGGTVSSGTNPSVGLFGRSGGFGSESRQKAKESNGTGGYTDHPYMEKEGWSPRPSDPFQAYQAITFHSDFSPFSFEVRTLAR